MIYLEARPMRTLEDAIALLQMAINIEFGTLPPYLYALYSIKPGTNAPASSRIKSVAMEEMVHMCLACNILNALGTNPVLTAPTYPGPLPGGISGGGKEALVIHLFPVVDLDQILGLQAKRLAVPGVALVGKWNHRIDPVVAAIELEGWAEPARRSPVPPGRSVCSQRL